MIHINKLNEMLEVIQNERGIPKAVLKDAVAAALLSACKKKFHTHEHLRCELSDEGEGKIFAAKTVVEAVTNDEIEISLANAKKINKKAEIGETVDVDVTPEGFGRMAAQTAKQVIIQRIREAEKEKAFEEFSQKAGDLITGVVQRREGNAFLINLGRIETLLVPQEQIKGENFRVGDHVKLYVSEVKKTPKGPLVMISRIHPGLVEKLFVLEIPEISQGILEIKGVAREAGRRSKVAVHSKDKNVTAVGTCVGHMGNRIQNIVRELGNERVDIIEWNENLSTYISNALSPAKISKVILNKADSSAKVVVPANQLSLAIGKEGQNVRLASKLTGWKIDIASEEESVAAAKEEPSSDKIKIHEIAKEIGLSSKEIISKLKTLGIEAKAATSSITKEEKQKLLESLENAQKDTQQTSKESHSKE